MILNILLTLLLVFLNGFFVAAEFAIVKVRLSQVELRIRSGSSLAKLTKNLVTHLDAYLSATQLGITLASLGLGWIGEPVVSKILLDIFHFAGISISSDLAHQIAVPVAFIVITALHIIFGELAPKSLAIQRSEQIALAVSIPLKAFYLVFQPFIWLLNHLAGLCLKALGFGPASEAEGLHSADELRFLLEEGTKSGAIEPTEHILLENIFDFTDTPIKQIMVPRRKIVGLEISLGYDEMLKKFVDEGYSRMPVYEKSIDNIVGILYAKDLIRLMSTNRRFAFRNLIRPPFVVQESDKISSLLRDMQKAHVHIAVVLDEFGGTAGLVTMEDIIEEIVGEIQDEYDEESPDVEKLNENEMIVKAGIAINDLNDFLPHELPESEDYETLGGLLISEIGRIPELNEKIELGNYSFRILKRSKRQIELVKLFIESPPEESPVE